MAHKFSKQEATAQRLIEKNGQAGTVTRKVHSGTAHDPDIEDYTSPVQVVLLNYRANEIGEGILASDRKALISTEGFDLQPAGDSDQLSADEQVLKVGDLLAVAEGEYRVIDPRPLRPAGDNIMYSAQVRI